MRTPGISSEIGQSPGIKLSTASPVLVNHSFTPGGPLNGKGGSPHRLPLGISAEPRSRLAEKVKDQNWPQ